MANVSDESSNNKINIVTNVENNVTVTQPNIRTVTVKTQGPRGAQGPVGAQGPAGDGDLSALNAFTGSAQASIDALNVFTGSGTFTTISASLVTATTGSFTHIKGNSPITIQDSVTFQQPVTGSVFSGSFVGNGSGLINVSATLPIGLVSSSAQIATEVSGAFGAPSASFSTRVTSLEDGGGGSGFSKSGISGSLGANALLIRSLTAIGISGSFVEPSASFSTRVTTLEDNPAVASGTVSSSLQITQLGFVTSSATSSFVTNSQTGSFLTSLPIGLLSGSAQIASEISGAFASPFSSAGITGSFNIASASFSTRVTSLEDGGGSSGFTSAGISGSLGANASLIRSLTALGISGSFAAPSASFSTRVTALEGSSSTPTGTVSGSAQITTLGFVTSSATASFVTNSETASFVTNSQTGSFLTSLPSGLLSGSAQIASSISGSFVEPSASFSTRVTTLENAGGGGTPTFIASGSTSASADPGTGIVVNHSGSTAFSVIGDVGTLFSVDDDLTGTLFSVNDISGIPQLEVSASGKVEVGKGPLIANTFETGSITNGSPSSPLQMTMPSGSSKQSFGVGGYYRVSWDDGDADHTFWEDDNIRLSYDVSGVDIEGRIMTDPSTGEIHITLNKDGTRAALDKQVSDNGFDLNSTIGSDDKDEYTFAAPLDPTWPFYKVTVIKTSATHNSGFYAIIEKFI